MKIAEFRAILAAAERIYRDGGNAEVARSLGLVGTLLSSQEAMTVPAFATKIAKMPATENANDGAQTALENAGTVSELQVALGHVATFCETVRANLAAKDLKTFAEALAPHAGKAIDAFCAAVENWLREEAQQPKGRSRASAKKGAASNEEAISSYLAELRNVGTDREEFERALEKLKADKSLKKPDVAAIARQYADTVTKYKSIAAAHADIAKAFTQQARFANKVG